MNSRDEILQRLRSRLAVQPSPPLPPPAEVWQRQSPPVDEMAARFAAELQEVHGEFCRVATMEAARARLADLAREEAWTRVAPFDRPLCRELTCQLPAELVAWPRPEWTPSDMEDFSASVIEADHLLADTGSSLVACETPQDRILCYLPPTCVIVATADRLAEHLPAAWESIAARAAEPDRRGEFVLVTGPSRTADIEKILILGVHGPKRLLVLLVG